MTTDVAVWTLVIALGVGTFLFRSSFILLFGRLDEVPAGAERALRFVPAAVLAALALPRLIYLDGSLAVSPGNERLLAGIVAAATAWRTESLLATVAVGMAALWFLTLVVG